tara:strand:- start:59 stop:556 length:498 start_codon:yes stop_codon:yes gene_type:complete
MAKRGYRGGHPYNDMKVSKHSESTSKRNPKLDAEYAKLHPKQKYSYIRDHQGFFPQATATIVCHGNNDDEETITIISTDGTSVTYTGEDDGTTASANKFNTGGNDVAAATGLKTCIEHASGHNGKILVSRDSATLTLTQRDPGPDGNTVITSGLTGGSKTDFTGG